MHTLLAPTRPIFLSSTRCVCRRKRSVATRERCFWAMLRKKRVILQKKRLLLYWMRSLQKRACEKHQKNAFDFFLWWKMLAVRTSAAPNTSNLLVQRVEFQSFNARSGTTRKLSPFNLQRGALLVNGDFLWTKSDLLANEGCLLDRRQGLYSETQFERMHRFVIHPCKTEHAHEEIQETSTHLHKHTAQKLAQERNLLSPWNAVWCNIVSVIKWVWQCKRVVCSVVQCSWMQYTVKRTNVNLTPAVIRCTCRWCISSPSFSFLATSHSSLLSSLSQSLAPLSYCVCSYFSSACFCSYVHVQRWYLLQTHDVVVWRFASLGCFLDIFCFVWQPSGVDSL